MIDFIFFHKNDRRKTLNLVIKKTFRRELEYVWIKTSKKVTRRLNSIQISIIFIYPDFDPIYLIIQNYYFLNCKKTFNAWTLNPNAIEWHWPFSYSSRGKVKLDLILKICSKLSTVKRKCNIFREKGQGKKLIV